MSVAPANDDNPLSDEEVRAMGFEPSEDGWRRLTCVYCGDELRRPFAHWTGAGGSVDVDADCGPALLREIGLRLVEAAREITR